MTRNPILNAMIQRERLASDYRAAIAGNRHGAGRILAALQDALRRCIGGGV